MPKITIPPELIVTAEAKAAEKQKAKAVKLRVETYKADPVRVDMLERLKTATPEEIETYITNNVTSLAQARTFLIALTKVLAIAVQD